MILILLGLIISMGAAIFLLVRGAMWVSRTTRFDGETIDVLRFLLVVPLTFGIAVCSVAFIALLVCMFNIIFGIGCGGCT